MRRSAGRAFQAQGEANAKSPCSGRGAAGVGRGESREPCNGRAGAGVGRGGIGRGPVTWSGRHC